MAGLNGQMGGLSLGPNGPPQGQAPAPRKKKDRHAYHVLEQPAPDPQSQPYGNQMQPPGPGMPYQQSSFIPAAPSPSLYGQPASPAPPFPQPGPQQGFPFRTGTPQQAQQHPQSLSGQPPGVSMVMGQPGPSGQPGVNPDQLPSVPHARFAQTRHYQTHVYPTMENWLAPQGGVPYVAVDQANSSPKFARLTMTTIPSTAEALNVTGLPLGLVLQPLAKLQEEEQQVPVLDFGDVGPPRCRRCRAYINPFMQFAGGGNRMVCNLCTHPNEVPTEYFAPTDPSGVRVDREQRPELKHGTVEFLVPREYWAKEPIPLRWLFLIDVSAEASSRGFLAGICDGILNALYDDQAGDDAQQQDAPATSRLPKGVKVGIATFNRDVHFYNLNPKLDHAQMIIMPDLSEPFVPIGTGLFVDPIESKGHITTLLKQIPEMFARMPVPEPALLPALNAALSALKPQGGKVLCSLSALPTFGPGRLAMRDKGDLGDVEAEKKLFAPESTEWQTTASNLVKESIGVDFFLESPSGGYLDLATIGHCSATSGGEMFFYPNFQYPRDLNRLSQEIKHTLTRTTGYQALMKVRCSNGLQISAYHGNFVQHTFGADLEYGAIDADKALSVMFSHDGKLDAKFDACFQSALLYTTASGERRVRCSNLSARVAGTAQEAIRFVDQDAVLNIIAKEATARITERSLKDIRTALTERTVDILASHRKLFAGARPPGQLLLPEQLKEFSMYTLGLLKSRAFKAGREPRDRRMHDLRMIRSMGPLELSLYLYPRIISIHNLTAEEGYADENGHLRIPEPVRASYGRIEPGGVYIVDDGQVCLLWLHAQVSPNLLEDLFGTGYNDLTVLDPNMSSLPVLDTQLSTQVRNILSYLSQARGSKGLAIQLARQGLDGAELEFARLLYEDPNGDAQSYVDWLVHLHRQVQEDLSGHRKKDEGGAAASLTSSVAATFSGLSTPYWG